MKSLIRHLYYNQKNYKNYYQLQQIYVVNHSLTNTKNKMTLSFLCFTEFITNDDIKTCKICKHYNVIHWVCSKVVKHGSKHLACVCNGQDCLYSSNLKVELRCKATTTLACPPEPGNNNGIATASNTQRFVPG